MMETQADQQPLLEIRDLVIQFAQQPPVVDRLNLQINKNQFLAIVGESGSGKSLTALSILSLLPENVHPAGEMVFHDAGRRIDLMRPSREELRNIRGNRISMIFQEPMTSLNPIMKCGLQVMEVLIQHKKTNTDSAEQETFRLFYEVELPDPERIFRSYPHELSGGQRQRVMIAMAIAAKPALLIADEPTTALDVRIQAGVVALLKRFQQQYAMSVLFITHDLGLVADIANKVVVLRGGKNVETGTTKEILFHPVNPYTKALLACRPAANPPQTELPEMDKPILSSSPIPYPEPSTTATPTALLQVTDLVVEVKDRKSGAAKSILGPVNFQIQEGETIGLVGESGCGKTTLGKTIVGLQTSNSGNIIFEGADIQKLTVKDRREITAKIQMVFQDPFGSLDPRVPIGKAIMEPLSVHHIGHHEAERRELAIQMLKKVKLSPEHFSRYPHEFSGGQRQRICIARALILQPRLLIFDESVSALDVSVQAGILNLIAELKGELGFSTLFISHDLSVIHHISNRILVMQKGLIVETGPASQVFLHPQQPYTRQLIAAIPGKKLQGFSSLKESIATGLKPGKA